MGHSEKKQQKGSPTVAVSRKQRPNRPSSFATSPSGTLQRMQQQSIGSVSYGDLLQLQSAVGNRRMKGLVQRNMGTGTFRRMLSTPFASTPVRQQANTAVVQRTNYYDDDEEDIVLNTANENQKATVNDELDEEHTPPKTVISEEEKSQKILEMRNELNSQDEEISIERFIVKHGQAYSFTWALPSYVAWLVNELSTQGDQEITDKELEFLCRSQLHFLVSDLTFDQVELMKDNSQRFAQTYDLWLADVIRELDVMLISNFDERYNVFGSNLVGDNAYTPQNLTKHLYHALIANLTERLQNGSLTDVKYLPILFAVPQTFAQYDTIQESPNLTKLILEKTRQTDLGYFRGIYHEFEQASSLQEFSKIDVTNLRVSSVPELLLEYRRMYDSKFEMESRLAGNDETAQDEHNNLIFDFQSKLKSPQWSWITEVQGSDGGGPTLQDMETEFNDRIALEQINNQKKYQPTKLDNTIQSGAAMKEMGTYGMTINDTRMVLEKLHEGSSQDVAETVGEVVMIDGLMDAITWIGGQTFGAFVIGKDIYTIFKYIRRRRKGYKEAMNAVGINWRGKWSSDKVPSNAFQQKRYELGLAAHYAWKKTTRALALTITKMVLKIVKFVSHLLTVLSGGLTAIVTGPLALAADITRAVIGIGQKVRGFYKLLAGKKGVERKQNAETMLVLATSGDELAARTIMRVNPFDEMISDKGKSLLSKSGLKSGKLPKPNDETELIDWLQNDQYKKGTKARELLRGALARTMRSV